jgi:hypothetical protein
MWRSSHSDHPATPASGGVKSRQVPEPPQNDRMFRHCDVMVVEHFPKLKLQIHKPLAFCGLSRRYRRMASDKERQSHCTLRAFGWARIQSAERTDPWTAPCRGRSRSAGASAGRAVFHMPAELTMTVLLHSRPPSPKGSGRWSVTVICPVSVTAVSGNGALRAPSASLI